jgi:thioredoxin:protein disulfide reductase
MKRFLFLWLLTTVVPAFAADASRSALSFFDSLRSDQPVDPEKAFRITVSAVGPESLVVRFDVDNCCYLYRHQIKFGLKNQPDAVRLGEHQLPPGKSKTDQFLGKVEVYEQPINVVLPVTQLVSARDAALVVSYQGCATTPIAICYPPTTKEFALRDIVAGVAGMSTASAPPPPAAAASGGFAAFLAGAFGLGLLLTFTPCVLPMIPILSSAIVGTNERRFSKWEGALLSYSYVLGTAVTFTVAGYVAGATGQQLQAYFQTPWAIGLFSILLALLALSMFGVYKIQIPSAIQSFLHHHGHRVHQRTRHFSGGAYVGVFLLGLLSALIIGACATPILLAALGTAVERGDPLLGAGIMFALAHGQGLILIALGVGASFMLPKAGPWMDRVKHLFGALLIAVAIYLLGALPEIPILLLWGTFFIISGVFLGALQRAETDNGWRLIDKGVGIVLMVWGTAALIGGFMGERDVLRPLSLTSLDRGAVTTPAEVATTRVRTVAELDAQLAAARAAAKPVLIDYYADWCLDCVRMEQTTFRDGEVVRELARFTVIQADVTDATTEDARNLRKRFDVYAPPALVFVDAYGRHRLAYGYRSAAELVGMLKEL